jgi:hypothetical protein
MKLISCEDCGVVIDVSRVESTTREIKVSRSGVVGKEPGMKCPCCGREICLEDGQMS